MNQQAQTVVIADDNAHIRKKLVEYFSKEGFNVVGDVSDGEQAVAAVLECCPDLIVFDVLLPTFDGFEILEKLNSLPKKPKTIVLSSLNNDGFAAKALSLGANYYMLKPVHADVITKRARDVLAGFSHTETLLFHGETRHHLTPNNQKRRVDKKISDIFITVGIPAHIKGYQFLREAIRMAIDDPEIINSVTKQLYPSIAQRFETSASKVERAIRHAIEVAWNRGKIENINEVFGLTVYGSNEKPTNSEFIALVADKMLLEGA